MLDRRDILEEHHAIGCRAQHRVFDFLELLETRVRDDKIKFVVLLELADGDEHVRSRERRRHFVQRHVKRLELVGIDGDAVFLGAPALHADTRDTLHRRESGAQRVEREIAQPDERL